ncbi:hypothetical protein OHB06_45390 [Streptomyces sp. NBC_01604]|uniref:hypothetical protein n=1 Tax=Streptomyces sp. NBC_01604 TaxID=2975894 RepID=UPI003865D2D4
MPASDPVVVSSYGDPVGELVRAAVADRSLEDIVHLVTLLERSSEYAQATVAALRAVGVDRSVDDVARLIALLTRPPRDADSADEAIRAAAECRPLEDVTRLVALLHRTPLEPHCGQEAVRAAATGRPVEELVELIGRLAEEQPAHPQAPAEQSGPDWGPADEAVSVDDTPAPDHLAGPRSARAPGQTLRPASWPARLAALVLVVCGLLGFPPHRDGESLRVYGFALGVSVLCLALGLLLTMRPAVPVLVAAVLVPAGVAAPQLFENRFHSAGLSRAMDLSLAPDWLVGTAAVCASLAALTALLARLAVPQSHRSVPAERQMAGASRVAD